VTKQGRPVSDLRGGRRLSADLSPRLHVFLTNGAVVVRQLEVDQQKSRCERGGSREMYNALATLADHWPEARRSEGRKLFVSTKSELAKLAGEIGWYQEEARKAVMLALQYKLEIGQRLARAKTLLPHGEFLAWAQAEFGWTARHVQRHLTLAENAPRVSCLPPDTSLRMALAAIRELRANIDAGEASPEVESSRDSQSIHITGRLEPGTIDRERLLAEIERLAGELGAEKMRWTIR
jgi:Protein of unknown function (DUF3102)